MHLASVSCTVSALFPTHMYDHGRPRHFLAVGLSPTFLHGFLLLSLRPVEAFAVPVAEAVTRQGRSSMAILRVGCARRQGCHSLLLTGWGWSGSGGLRCRFSSCCCRACTGVRNQAVAIYNVWSGGWWCRLGPAAASGDGTCGPARPCLDGGGRGGVGTKGAQSVRLTRIKQVGTHRYARRLHSYRIGLEGDVNRPPFLTTTHTKQPTDYGNRTTGQIQTGTNQVGRAHDRRRSSSESDAHSPEKMTGWRAMMPSRSGSVEPWSAWWRGRGDRTRHAGEKMAER